MKVNDASVTRMLEAYAEEPIRAVKLLQGFDLAQDSDGPLDIEAGATVLRRRVVLQGRRSGRKFLHAETVLAPARIDTAIVCALMATDEPIGALLADAGTETSQEILGVPLRPAGRCALPLGIDPSDEVVSVTRRLFSGRRPIMVIRETFPSRWFEWATCDAEVTGGGEVMGGVIDR